MPTRRSLLTAGAFMATAAVAKPVRSQVTGTASITLWPSGSDDTSQIMAALASFGSRGGELVLNPGVYLVPNGIVSTVPGLVVRGIGTRAGSSGVLGVGALLQASNPGVWVWQQVPAGSGNEYRGARFENITFQGNNTTAGGLLLRTCYNVVRDCASYGNTVGTGFMTQPPVGGDDASWNWFEGVLSENDFTGFQIGTGSGGAASAQLFGCINLKQSASGIQGQGYAVVIYDNNSAVHGGKYENNSIAILSKATPGVIINAPRFEKSTLYDISLNRDSGTNGTRNLVIAQTSKIFIGPFQNADTIIGGGWEGVIVDQGKDTIILGNRIVKHDHIGATTPTGGYPGEIRVANGRLWVNDNGAWRSVAVA
jgi:hypothetical protein